MNTYDDYLVSIIVPVYNVETYLEDCIKCLRRQTYNNIEIVLIDDGSTDSSGVMCEAYSQIDDRIIVIHKENGGLSDARNVGIQACKGKLFCCVDSDDLVSSYYIETLLNGMLKNDCDISIGKIIAFSGDINPFTINTVHQEQSGIIECKIMTSDEALNHMLLQNEFDVSACGKLYKKELFSNVSYPVGKIYEDLATTYKIVAKSKKICFINIPIYAYRRNREGSITYEKFNLKKMELLESYKDFYEYVVRNKPALKTAADCRYAGCATIILESLYFSGERVQHIRIENKMKSIIRKRLFYIIMQRQLLFRRKIKMICAGLGKPCYEIIHKLYYR